MVSFWFVEIFGYMKYTKNGGKQCEAIKPIHQGDTRNRNSIE